MAVKGQHAGEWRRFRVSPEISFSDFVDRACCAFGVEWKVTPNVHYLDEEGDNIKMTTTAELREALKWHLTLSDGSTCIKFFFRNGEVIASAPVAAAAQDDCMPGLASVASSMASSGSFLGSKMDASMTSAASSDSSGSTLPRLTSDVQSCSSSCSSTSELPVLLDRSGLSEIPETRTPGPALSAARAGESSSSRCAAETISQIRRECDARPATFESAQVRYERVASPVRLPACLAATRQLPERQAPHTIHMHVICDKCQASPIRGIRFKCLICADFDMCMACAHECDITGASVGGHHADHTMLRLPRSDMTFESSFEHHPMPNGRPSERSRVTSGHGQPASSSSVAAVVATADITVDAVVAPRSVVPTPSTVTTETQTSKAEQAHVDTQTPSVSCAVADTQTLMIAQFDQDSQTAPRPAVVDAQTATTATAPVTADAQTGPDGAAELRKHERERVAAAIEAVAAPILSDSIDSLARGLSVSGPTSAQSTASSTASTTTPSAEELERIVTTTMIDSDSVSMPDTHSEISSVTDAAPSVAVPASSNTIMRTAVSRATSAASDVDVGTPMSSQHMSDWSMIGAVSPADDAPSNPLLGSSAEFKPAASLTEALGMLEDLERRITDSQLSEAPMLVDEAGEEEGEGVKVELKEQHDDADGIRVSPVIAPAHAPLYPALDDGIRVSPVLAPAPAPDLTRKPEAEDGIRVSPMMGPTLSAIAVEDVSASELTEASASAITVDQGVPSVISVYNEDMWKSTHSSLNVGDMDRLDTWSDMMALLADMGFNDGPQNRQLLVEHQGNLETVVAHLLASPSQMEEEVN